MHPVHDVDALLLLATALSSKRRPAELAEIMAAADLIQGAIPAEQKLVEAFARLGRNGLLCTVEGGIALTPVAQEMMADLPRKMTDADERVFSIKGKLAAYNPEGEQAAVELAAWQFSAAIHEHRTAGAGAGKNLLVPKPKPEEAKPRPGQRQRKPAPPRRRG
ncbi:MAG: hypothetical protein WC023_00680 [Rhodocyclaceae bacterium]|jgi:hypothetical protein